MTWKPVSQLVKVFEHGTDEKRILIVTVQLDPIFVVAVDAVSPTKDADRMTLANEVLDDHGHRIVGEFDSLPQALEAAENFGLQWSLGRPIERCDCTEFDELDSARQALRRAHAADRQALMDEGFDKEP